MTESDQPLYFIDRRNGKERRKFSYTLHLPERRNGMDRRSNLERLSKPGQISIKPKMEDKSIVDEFL